MTTRVVIGVCAMDKKTHAKPMQSLFQRLPPEEFEVRIFGDDVILNQPVEEWPLCDCLIAFFSGKFPLKKAERYVELRKPFCLTNLTSEWVFHDRRLVYEVLKRHGIPTPKHYFVNRDGFSDNLANGSGESFRATRELIGLPLDGVLGAARAAGVAGAVSDSEAKTPQRNNEKDGPEGPFEGLQKAPGPPGPAGPATVGVAEGTFEEGEDFVVMNGVKVAKPFVEKPVDAEDHNVYV